MAAIRPVLATPSNDTIWRALFDTVPFYVAIVSPTGVLLSLNRSGAGTVQQAVGKSVTDIAPNADPSFTAALKAVVDGGIDAAQAEFAYSGAKGTRWFSCHLVPLKTDGAVTSVLVVGFDNTEAKQSGAELRMSVNALHRLLEEREELAADLHDGILQSLYGVGLRLEAARGVAGGGAGANPHLDRAIGQLNETMADIRRSIMMSRSSLAASSRWEETLAGVLRGLEVEGGPALVVELDPGAARRVRDDDRGELVFIAREAVSNAMRHARAGRITVRLALRDRGVSLEVEDDGQGFHSDSSPAGLGLLTMTRRAGRMGAILTIQTEPGVGTVVRLELGNLVGGP